MADSKVPFFFFFPGKVEGHSLTQIWRKLYFFFHQTWKKKYSCFFFPKNLQIHLIHFFGRNSLICKQKSCNFPDTSFFPELYFFCCIFFSWKSWNSLTHSFQKSVFFFSGTGKKKYSVFTHSLDFEQNCHKSLLYPGKKNTVPLPGGTALCKL